MWPKCYNVNRSHLFSLELFWYNWKRVILHVKINHINSAIYQKLACWVVFYSRNSFQVCFCLIEFLTVLGLRTAEPFFKFVDISRHCCKWNWWVLKERIFLQEMKISLVWIHRKCIPEILQIELFFQPSFRLLKEFQQTDKRFGNAHSDATPTTSFIVNTNKYFLMYDVNFTFLSVLSWDKHRRNWFWADTLRLSQWYCIPHWMHLI